MATLNSIKAQIAKLTKQAQAMESKAVQKVVALMDKLGVSIDDLPRGRARGRKLGGAVKQSASVAKYRDPATGKTWTGHGRAPEWIKNAANRDDFLADKSSGSAAPVKATKRASKTATKSSGRPAKKAAKSRKRAAAKSGSNRGEAS